MRSRPAPRTVPPIPTAARQAAGPSVPALEVAPLRAPGIQLRRPVGDLPTLQRSLGNQRLLRLLHPAARPASDPARLTFEGHPEEREADRVADLAAEGKEARVAGARELPSPPVTIHDDSRAHATAAVLGARAVTIGRDIHFAQGQLQPATREGRRLLAHELVHAAQPVGTRPAVRRKVAGNVTRQSIGPAFVRALSDAELREYAALLVGLLEGAPEESSAERGVLEMNLHLLEEEGALRGVDLPAVTAQALAEMAAPIQVDARLAATQLDAVAATEHGFPLRSPFGGGVNAEWMAWGAAQLSWVTSTLQQAMADTAAGRAGGADSDQRLRDAATGCVAGLFGLQAFRIWLVFAQTHATILTHIPGYSRESILVRMERVRVRLAPILGELQSRDAQRVERGVQWFTADAGSFALDYEQWMAQVKRGQERYEAFMKAFAAYQLALGVIGAGMALGGGGGGPLVSMRATGFGVGAGGTATMGSVAITVEWLEMIRRLGQIGALSAGMVTPALMAGGGSLTPPGMPPVMLRATPSGTTTPAKGPTPGKAESYGDSRNKHTKFADHTAAELDAAVKDPSKAPAILKDLKPNVGKPGYGSQLGKEATDRYEDLVKDALENGTRTGTTRIDHTATFDVGIDIISGTLTKNYRMYYSPVYGGWHLFPVL